MAGRRPTRPPRKPRCGQPPQRYGGSGQDSAVGNDDDEQTERAREGTGAYDDGTAEAVEEEGSGEAAQDYHRPTDTSRNLTFGFGTHACAGQLLARAETSMILGRVAGR
ncbi:hypothetical protein [Streptomyces sp. NPDC101234]|uniref:hypothetical protein n=1 Tax=Streptomyces sp. NPDC101234 TaxID=3366138 RepID=UPI00381B4D01